MSPTLLIVIYCVLISLGSVAGGVVPRLVRLDHRRMEIALSFVSGVMLGVSLLHLLPHALASAAAAAEFDSAHGHVHAPGVDTVMIWLIVGFLITFFLERLFQFHHHDVPHGNDDAEAPTPESCTHHDHHKLTWSGATVGLTVHTLIAGVALAAAVESEAPAAWAGLATFLVILLHKPFESLTITTLMTAGRHGLSRQNIVNLLFSLMVPIGALLFHLGLATTGESSGLVTGALAFSAGTFLCISLSDLLPELQFHHHDRLKLSGALLLGLALAWSIGMVEQRTAEGMPKIPTDAGISDTGGLPSGPGDHEDGHGHEHETGSDDHEH